MRRRDVLVGALGLGAGVSLASLPGLTPLAWAGDHPDLKDRYFIFCLFQGAWDVLLSLDPRDPREFTPERRRETRIDVGYDLVELEDADLVRTPDPGMILGPYAGRLVDHTDKLAIVRGMDQETVSHQVGIRRFLTGLPPAGQTARGSSTATWLASLLAQDELIPNLVAGMESYNVDRDVTYSGFRVSSVADLAASLATDEATPTADEQARIQALLADARDCNRHRRSPTRMAAHRASGAAAGLVQNRLDQLFRFERNTPDMVALRAHYGFNANQLGTAAARAAMAVTALTAGVSRVVSIRINDGSLDTHGGEWGTEQGPRQRDAFDLVAAMVEDLQSRPYKDTGDTWLDHTTIVLHSDFTRTPMLNPNVGRDHHIMGCCALLGAGIKPGVVGASSDIGMEPQPIDLTTGRVDPGGEVPKPNHIMRTLYASVGLEEDLADQRVEPIRALLR